MNRFHNTFTFFPTDTQGISILIRSFKSKKCSFNEVVYKFEADELLPVFTTLYNESITLDIFPNCLKIARITLIFKTGNKKYVKSYHPTSSFTILELWFRKACTFKTV